MFFLWVHLLSGANSGSFPFFDDFFAVHQEFEPLFRLSALEWLPIFRLLSNLYIEAFASFWVMSWVEVFKTTFVEGSYPSASIDPDGDSLELKKF